GTSEFDFVNPLSKEGAFQNKLKVYNRKGKSCHNDLFFLEGYDAEKQEHVISDKSDIIL
ncbi:11054_t:CDS:2, partial [Racocetra fulgida]